MDNEKGWKHMAKDLERNYGATDDDDDDDDDQLLFMRQRGNSLQCGN